MLIEVNPFILQVKTDTDTRRRSQSPTQAPLRESTRPCFRCQGEKTARPCNQKILVLFIGKPTLNVCRRHDCGSDRMSWNHLPLEPENSGSEGGGYLSVALFTVKVPRFVSCMSYKPRLPSPLADPDKVPHSWERREINADQYCSMQGPHQNPAHQMVEQLSSGLCHLPLLLNALRA